MKQPLVLYVLGITASFTPLYSLTITPIAYIIVITEQIANFYALYDRLLMIENFAMTVSNRALTT